MQALLSPRRYSRGYAKIHDAALASRSRRRQRLPLIDHVHARELQRPRSRVVRVVLGAGRHHETIAGFDLTWRLAFAQTRKLDDMGAIATLEKALEIEPENSNAKGRLEQLKSYHRQR